MIKIKKLEDSLIFEKNEYLKDIWPPISSKIMQEATLDAMKNNEPGLFILEKNDKVIGFTGFYELEYPYVGLRWHGIIKEERNNGYSIPVLAMVAKLAQMHFPDYYYLAEFVPLTDYSQKIIDHFESAKFEKFGPIESHDWTPHKTQGYRAVIEDLKNIQNIKAKNKLGM